jgi:hypothetical protein
MILSAFLLITPYSKATTVRRLTLTEIRDAADTIVLGTVENSWSAWNDQGTMIQTHYRIHVEQVLRGPKQEPSLIVSFGGGATGSTSMDIAGMPQLDRGKRYLLFLYLGKPYLSPIVGFRQGIFEVQLVQTENGQQTVVLSLDGELVVSLPNGAIIRSGQWRFENGRLVALAPPQDSDRQDVPESSPLVLDALGNPVPQIATQEATRQNRLSFPAATLETFVAFVQGNVTEGNAP